MQIKLSGNEIKVQSFQGHPIQGSTILGFTVPIFKRKNSFDSKTSISPILGSLVLLSDIFLQFKKCSQ